MMKMKPKLTTSKANALPPVPSLQPKSSVLYKDSVKKNLLIKKIIKFTYMYFKSKPFPFLYFKSELNILSQRFLKIYVKKFFNLLPSR